MSAAWFLRRSAGHRQPTGQSSHARSEGDRRRNPRLSHLSIRYGWAPVKQTLGLVISSRRQPHRMTDRSPDFIVAVVDDDQRILESLGDLLESAGHAVRLFTSAAALLGNGGLPEIDCLISDIDLPGRDGFELLRLVHAARPELPVILITGHPEMADRAPPRGSGHYRLFRKPLDGHELLTAVGDAVRSSRGV